MVTFNMIAPCPFFQMMGIDHLLAFVSSVHSTLGSRAANCNKRKNKRTSRQRDVVSPPHTQIPRQDGEGGTGVGFPWDHFIILNPSPCGHATWQGGHGRLGPLCGAVWAWGAEASTLVVSKGWSADTVWDRLFQPQSLARWNSWPSMHKCPPTSGRQWLFWEASGHSWSLVWSSPLTWEGTWREAWSRSTRSFPAESISCQDRSPIC